MTKPIKTIQKSVFKWIIGIFLAILIVLILSISLITTSPGENFLRRKIEQKLQEMLGQQVIIGNIETNLFSRFQVHNLTIFRRDGLKQISFLELGYAHVDYQLWHLLTRKLSIKSINIDSLCVTVLKDSSGFYNLPIFEKNDKQKNRDEKSRFHISLGNVDLNNIMIKYHDRTVPVEVSLNNLNFNLRQNDLDNYNFQLQLGSGKLTYHKEPFVMNELNLSGLFKNHELKVEQLSLQISELGCVGKAAIDFDSSPYLIRGNLNIRGELSQFSKFLQDFSSYKISFEEGIFESNLEFSGNIKEPQINFQINLPNCEIADILVKNGKLKGIYEANRLTLDKMYMETMEGNIQGQGNIGLDSLLAHNFTLSIEGMSLDDVLQFIYNKKSPYTGLIGGKIESKGPLKDFLKLQVYSQFKLQKVKYASQLIPDFNTSISFNQGLTGLEFNQGDSKIQANFRLINENLKGEFFAHIHKLEQLAGLFNIFETDGIFDITGTISGRLKEPKITANLTGREIHYQNFPVDTLYGNIYYKKGNIYFEEGLIAGTLTSIDSLTPIFNIPDLHGGISYQGNFRGAIDNLEGNLTAKFFNTSYQDFQLDSASLKITLDDKKAVINSFKLYRDSLLTEITGEYFIPLSQGNLNIAFYDALFNSKKNIDQQNNLLLGNRHGDISASFDISDTQNLIFKMQGKKINIQEVLTIFPTQIKAGGSLDFQLDFSGIFEQPSSKLQLFIESPEFEYIFFDSIKADLNFNEDILSLGILEIFIKDNRTWSKGEIELHKTTKGTYTISDKCFTSGIINGADIDLRLLNPLIKSDKQFAGNSIVKLEWEGAVKKPDIRGKLQILDGQVKLSQDTKPIEAIQLKAVLKDSLLQVENFSGKIQGIPFNLGGILIAENLQEFQTQVNLSVSNFDILSGKGTINKDSVNFNLSIKDFNISILQGLISELKQLSGIVNSKLFFKGPIKSPYISGDFKIQKLSFQPNLLNTPFTQGIISINFDRDYISLDSLFVHLNNGSILASGSLAYQDNKLTQLNFKTFVNNIKIVRPKEYIVTVNSAQLNYQKKDNFYELDGDIILGENRLLYNFQPKFILSLMKTVERPSEAPPDIIKQTRLNVRLRESDDLWVDNNLARLRLHSELGFIGSLSQPIITGRLSFVEGYILYLDRKFKINNGTMDFIDPNRLNPIVDFKAEANIKSYQTLAATPYQIIISIRGALDELTVALTSEPPLDRPNIISLLTIGATREQMTGGEKSGDGVSFSDVLRRRIEMLSSQKVSNYAARNVGNLFGFDQVSIEGNLFNFGKSWGPQLLASKKISDRVEITYTTTVGHLNEQRIRLDYILSKYFSLEGQTDQRGRSGLDLKYRLKFK